MASGAAAEEPLEILEAGLVMLRMIFTASFSGAPDASNSDDHSTVQLRPSSASVTCSLAL